MPRVWAPLVLLLLWLMRTAASPHALRIGEYHSSGSHRGAGATASYLCSCPVANEMYWGFCHWFGFFFLVSVRVCIDFYGGNAS